MTIQTRAQTGLDYAPCRYGASRTLFRGPARSLDGGYIPVLGSAETYGRFVARPYPDLVEEALGRPVVNFGCINAGLDVFINDPVIMRVCKQAPLTVLQIPGAQNMSNRFYKVHPRRNDRFLRPSRRMADIWPEVNFDEIHFTKHLISALYAVCPKRFKLLRRELAEAWVARVRSMISALDGRVVLLWMADRRPEQFGCLTDEAGPLFVTREMIESVRDIALDIVEVVATRPYGPAEIDGMIYEQIERPVALGLPGPNMHGTTAEALAPRLEALL